MFWKKKKTRLELLREAALDRAQDALDVAHDVLHQASDAVHGKLEHAPEKLNDLKSGATDTLGEAVSRLGSAVAGLGAKAQSAAGGASKSAHERAEEARHVLDDKRHLLEEKLARKKHEAEKAVRHAVDNAPQTAPDTTVILTDASQKWLWLGAGILAGVVIGVLLAPASGRRNRALLRDKVSKGAHKAEGLGDAASRKARDLGNRAEGVAHTVTKKLHDKRGAESDRADDVTIADRVRAALGHLPVAHELERINIDCYKGVVTLRGPIVDAATEEALLMATLKVPGVREVVSDLLVDHEDDEAFLG